MADVKPSVKIIDGALHESSLRGGTLILRGVIDASTFPMLKFDDYQREALPTSSRKNLINALKKGDTLPDIEIGMRGSDARERSGVWTLHDDCFVIDGQQRVLSSQDFLTEHPEEKTFLGAAIHFDTDKEWERERFRVLNSQRVKVSPNVLLRNLREDHLVLSKLYDMTMLSDETWCLGGRISWDQNMKRGKLITALNFLKTVGALHGHISAGKDYSLGKIGPGLDLLAQRVGIPQMQNNISTFFDVVDGAWGVKKVQYRELSVHLAGSFLGMLARFFSDHLDFWKGANEYKFVVERDIRNKIGTFPVNDPGIAPLTSSQGASRHVLYGLFVKHVNSGKRTKKLKPRVEAYDSDEGILDNEGAE